MYRKLPDNRRLTYPESSEKFIEVEGATVISVNSLEQFLYGFWFHDDAVVVDPLLEFLQVNAPTAIIVNNLESSVMLRRSRIIHNANFYPLHICHFNVTL